MPRRRFKLPATERVKPPEEVYPWATFVAFIVMCLGIARLASFIPLGALWAVASYAILIYAKKREPLSILYGITVVADALIIVLSVAVIGVLMLLLIAKTFVNLIV